MYTAYFACQEMVSVLLRRGTAKARQQILDVSTHITNKNVLEKFSIFSVKDEIQQSENVKKSRGVECL